MVLLGPDLDALIGPGRQLDRLELVEHQLGKLRKPAQVAGQGRGVDGEALPRARLLGKHTEGPIISSVSELGIVLQSKGNGHFLWASQHEAVTYQRETEGIPALVVVLFHLLH